MWLQAIRKFVFFVFIVMQYKLFPINEFVTEILDVRKTEGMLAIL